MHKRTVKVTPFFKSTVYLFIYLFIYTFWGTYLQVRPVYGFSRMMAQTTYTHAEMCFFAALVDVVNPKKTSLVACICIFKSNSWKRKNAYYQSYTAPISIKLYTVIKISKCTSWVVQRSAQEIQDGGRLPYYEKSNNQKISSTVWPTGMKFIWWRTLYLCNSPAVKN